MFRRWLWILNLDIQKIRNYDVIIIFDNIFALWLRTYIFIQSQPSWENKADLIEDDIFFSIFIMYLFGFPPPPGSRWTNLSPWWLYLFAEVVYLLQCSFLYTTCCNKCGWYSHFFQIQNCSRISLLFCKNLRACVHNNHAYRPIFLCVDCSLSLPFSVTVHSCRIRDYLLLDQQIVTEF
jgi:hypothetical protein